MRILIACEFSGVVRDAFRARGHDAWSCDIVPTERPGPHIVNDVRNVLDWGWDLMIAHPPCTYLSRCGARYYNKPGRAQLTKQAMEFFMDLWYAPIPAIAIENTIGKAWQLFRKPDQIVQPWQFGHPQTKATCLWLKDLPPLMASQVIVGPGVQVNWVKYYAPKTGHERSRTFPGIAAAMAAQWGIR